MGKKKKLTSKQCLALSLAVMLLVACMASLILHDFGRISVSTEYTQTLGGKQIAVKIYRPKSATADSPAPLIVFLHGMSCNKETYTNYGLELARRGFVVAMPDLLSHGQSEIATMEELYTPENEALGAYTAVRYMKDKAYVDENQVGVAGHSFGGAQANACVQYDDMEPTQSIKAVYIVASNPAYSDGSAFYTNYYGDRNVGVYYTMYDHVFFSTTNEAGDTLVAQQYLSSDSAKSLVTAGGDPSEFDGDAVQPGHIYTNDVNGKVSQRVIYASKDIHASGEVSHACIAGCINLFEDTFQVSDYREGAQQIWPWYSVFSFGCLAAFVFFACSLVKCLTDLKCFASLGVKEAPVLAPAPDKKGKLFFWCMTIVNVLFAILSITVIYSTKYSYWQTVTFPQQMTNVYAFWGTVNGAFMLLSIFFAYFFYARKNGTTLKDWGLAIGWKNFLKSVAIAAIVLVSFGAFLEFSVRVLGTDFRYYMWGITVIPFDARIRVFLIYLPLFLLSSIPLAISVNSTYYQKIKNEPEWVNDLFFALLQVIPSLLITVVGYSIFIKNGYMPGNVFGSTYTHTYTVNAIPMFALVVLANRRFRKVCSNPYIPGIISGVLLCWMNVSCAMTVFMDYIGY